MAAVHSPIREVNHRLSPRRIASCQVIDPKHIVLLLADRSGEAVTAFDIIPTKKIPADFLKKIDGEKGRGLSAHRGLPLGTDCGIISHSEEKTCIEDSESEANTKLPSQEAIENWFWKAVEKQGLTKAKAAQPKGSENLTPNSQFARWNGRERC